MSQKEKSELGGFKAWSNWTISVSFVVLVFSLQTGYAITNPSLAKDLGLTIVQVGLVGTIYTWAFAFTQLASGSILDRLGGRWVLPVACFIVAIAAFLFANATGMEMLIAANVLAAIGGSFGFIGAGFTGGQWFAPYKYGFMFSLVQFAASLSAIVGQRIMGAMIETVPWNDLINGLALIAVAISVVMFIFMREPAGGSSRNHTWPGFKPFVDELLHSLHDVIAVRDTWVNALIGGATMGTMLGIGVVWGPRMLVAGGMDQGEAFMVSSLSWAGLAVGAPLFSWLSSLMKSRVRPMAVGCFLQLVAIVLIMVSRDVSVTVLSIEFFAFGFMAGGSMLPFTIGAELVPPTLIGTSAALVNATQFIVGGIMMAAPGRVLAGEGMIAGLRQQLINPDPGAVATLSDHQWALLIMPVTLAIGLFLCAFLKETYPSPSSPADKSG